MNVVLIGYRCAGKSTVGSLLARQLRADFIDCDTYIEAKTHLSIREIFDLCGEPYFRSLEGTAIGDLCKRDGQVIATGGGAALRYKNIKNLKKNGIVIFLDVAADLAFERMSQDSRTATQRPPLTSKDPLREVQEQIAFRRQYYFKAADLHVKSDERSAAEVVAEIIAHLTKLGYPFPGDDREHSLT